MDGSRHIVAMAASAVRARVGRHWRIVAVAAAFVIAASTTAAQQRRPGRIGGPRPVLAWASPESMPAELEVTGRTEGGVVMALRHRELPIQGVQFHPESVLTEGGHRMLANWMASAGHPAPEADVASLTAEMAELSAHA